MSDGERIRAARQKIGRQQVQIALWAGVSPQYLNDVELGRRIAPDDTYGRICVAVGIVSDRPAVRLPKALGALTSLLDAAERAYAGYPLPAEEWYAVRDAARAMLAGERD